MTLDKSKKVELMKFYGILVVVAFSLNWIWEMAQMFSFEIKPEANRLQASFFCTLASVIDLLTTIGIYALLRRIDLKNRVLFYLFAAMFGGMIATLFEWVAFRFELWSYNPSMPMLPIIGVGLLPFAQLTMLVPFAIWIANKKVP